MPRIEAVKATSPYILSVTWKGGGKDRVNLEGVVSRFKPFAPLRDPKLFRQVEIINWGSGIEWPNGLDYAATSLQRIADIQRAAKSPMSGAKFKAWQKRCGLTNAETAAVLGFSERQIKNYRSGASPVPRAVQLTAHQIDRDPALLNALYRRVAAE